VKGHFQQVAKLFHVDLHPKKQSAERAGVPDIDLAHARSGHPTNKNNAGSPRCNTESVVLVSGIVFLTSTPIERDNRRASKVLELAEAIDRSSSLLKCILESLFLMYLRNAYSYGSPSRN